VIIIPYSLDEAWRASLVADHVEDLNSAGEEIPHCLKQFAHDLIYDKTVNYAALPQYDDFPEEVRKCIDKKVAELSPMLME